MLEWRIRESGHGGFVAEYGAAISSEIEAPTGIGFLMPGFMIYESAHFDTKKQAQGYIKRQTKKK